MNKKVILSVTNDLVSDQRIHKIATSLTKFGYEVTLIGRKFKDSPSLDRVYKTKRISLLFNTKIWFYAEYNIRLFLYLLFHNYDIYVANDLDTILPNFIISKIKRKKFVYDSHELFTEVVELNTRPLQKKMWLFIEKMILPKSKNNITVCKSIADYYENEYGNKFGIIRNIPTFKNNIDIPVNGSSDDKVVIYQGALNTDRGIELMIVAFKFIDNVKLWIVGSGDVEQELKILVVKSNLQDKVVFKGRIPLENMPEITNKASLGLSLEEDTSLSYHYALPNKMFDYIHAGIPVIVSDLPEMKSIVEIYKVGEVFTKRTAENLAEIINKLLFKDLKLYSQYRVNTKFASSELNWENEEKELKRIYSELV